MNKMLKLPLFLGICGGVCAGLLGGVYALTNPIIMANEETKANQAYIDTFKDYNVESKDINKTLPISDALKKAGVTVKASIKKTGLDAMVYSCEITGSKAAGNNLIKFQLAFANGKYFKYTNISNAETDGFGKQVVDGVSDVISGMNADTSLSGNNAFTDLTSGATQTWTALKVTFEACAVDYLSGDEEKINGIPSTQYNELKALNILNEGHDFTSSTTVANYYIVDGSNEKVAALYTVQSDPITVPNITSKLTMTGYVAINLSDNTIYGLSLKDTYVELEGYGSTIEQWASENTSGLSSSEVDALDYSSVNTGGTASFNALKSVLVNAFAIHNTLKDFGNFKLASGDMLVKATSQDYAYTIQNKEKDTIAVVYNVSADSVEVPAAEDSFVLKGYVAINIEDDSIYSIGLKASTTYAGAASYGNLLIEWATNNASGLKENNVSELDSGSAYAGATYSLTAFKNLVAKAYAKYATYEG